MRALGLRFFIILLMLSDYIILTFHAPSVFGAWREGMVLLYILLTVLLVVFEAGTLRSIPRKYNEQLLVFAFFIAFYLMCGELSDSSFRMFRSFAMPVLFALMVNAVCRELKLEVKLRVIFSTLVMMTFISGCYAIYQYLTISDAEQFWYWPLLAEKGFELEAYNSMREGNARMSGFFTGTLEFNAFVLNTALFAVCLLVQAVRKRKYNLSFLAYLLATLFSAVLICYGSVRTAVIGMISAVFFLAVLQLFKRRIFISVLGYSYFLFFTCSIFLYLALGYTEDLSALDRIRQWYVVLESLSSMPLGLGFGAIGPGQAHWYDSFWLNLLASAGYLGLAVMIGLIAFYGKIVTVTQQLRMGGSAFMAGVADYLVISYPFFLSSFFFQSYTNSVVLYLFTLVIVVVMYDSKYRTN
ncbi:hypothetical protein [Pseudomonas sp. R11-23-07]|uniref:hypothetical protein n=1 Tax=Pseudomonas sp. R11-23-07 TaxID=658632 RepID=UPI000F565693|nr:hypothetical protein [Pseudomonas sp. R11-23-07]AZF57516.1 hypothetical protein C4J84_1625 [Pseudomonas sp. R11-23-07]